MCIYIWSKYKGENIPKKIPKIGENVSKWGQKDWSV